ncbi:Acetylcholinesterase [Penaeus vannamei]|uniref:Acetylcholinesterase n=1 Tax=Penaeus vannamei TaxID=6689 RepID=A0A3R7Q500_PENVA|nr:Acetylcholinesterase [Penaeus vannamei]
MNVVVCTLSASRPVAGVVHPAILQYLFPYSDGQPLTGADKQLSDTLLRLWVNFATTGDPTPDASLGFRWTPISASKQAYLSLTPTPTMTSSSRLNEWLLWTSFPTEANRFLHLDRIQDPRRPYSATSSSPAPQPPEENFFSFLLALICYFIAF